MLNALQHPVDVATILRRRKAIRTALFGKPGLLDLRIALLGGSTTAELRSLLELFLLDVGFRPTFFESDYGRFYEDAVVDAAALRAFRPQIAVVHTTLRNVKEFPGLFEEEPGVERRVEAALAPLRDVWRSLGALGVTVIQNNFELPAERSLGHLDATEAYGRNVYISRLNEEIARHARGAPGFFVNDIHYLAARVGLERWHDDDYWFSYKMAMSPEGTVALAQQTGTLVRLIFGKGRKCLVLDLDNTLWGGVIGEDGLAGLKLGPETPEGEAFSGFQRYCLELNRRGVLLAVCSKNELSSAREGFAHRDSVLRLGDFSVFKASWGPKDEAIREIAAELNLGLDSLVFVDDNPAERELVRGRLPEVAVPEVGAHVSRFIEHIERGGWFEPARISSDDAARSRYYAQDAERVVQQQAYGDYGEYLASLAMSAEIGAFTAVDLDRIAQLTNKTNQFNLTTQRYTRSEMQQMAEDPRYLTLAARLSDKFGQNGLVSLVIGERRDDDLHIVLWLMSCRVLKRDLELAMFDALVVRAQRAGVRRLVGRYSPTAKNAMVAAHYPALGFTLLGEDQSSGALYALNLGAAWVPRNRHIKEISNG